jgi:formylglycine-generating enzyme required for sulfatase activity
LLTRNDLALTMGKLGDPRIAKDLRDPSSHVELPAGRYAYEAGWQTVQRPFRLTRYLVTNSQFSLFLSDGGYSNQLWWSEEGWNWLRSADVREPAYWRDHRFNSPNQPVVGVSFWEAEAFCRWVGGRLPTENEWEAAARGPKRLVFPWGDQWKEGICNSWESHLGTTSAVGIFPRSRSAAFGLEDTAGNVWEWCRSQPEGEAPVFRVVRGGSWSDTAESCQCTSCDRIVASHRLSTVGFRVVWLPEAQSLAE